MENKVGKMRVIQHTSVIPGSNLEPEKFQEDTERESEKQVKDIEILHLTDITWRLENREKFKNFLIRLLVAQNAVVFAIVVVGMITDKMQGLQLVFATLVGGTLLETAAMVNLIVKWLFTEINYIQTNSTPAQHTQITS